MLTVDAWLQVINTLGVPVGVMLVMVFSIWKFFGWAAPRADKLIDSTQATMTRVAESSEKSADALEVLVPVAKTNAAMLEKISEEHDTTHGKIEQILELTKDIKRALKE